MHQAAPDKRSRRVEFRHHRCHAKRGEQTLFKVIRHREAACVGVLAVSQSTGGNIGKDDRGVGRILKLFARLCLKRLFLGPFGHIVAPVEEEHAHLGAFIRRIARFSVPQAAAHLEELFKRDIGAWIAASLPVGNGRGAVFVEQAIGDQHPDQHGGDGLRHRPADVTGVRIIALGVSFGSNLAIDHEENGTRFAKPFFGEKLVDLARKLILGSARVFAHGIERLLSERGRGFGGPVRARNEGWKESGSKDRGTKNTHHAALNRTRTKAKQWQIRVDAKRVRGPSGSLWLRCSSLWL